MDDERVVYRQQWVRHYRLFLQQQITDLEQDSEVQAAGLSRGEIISILRENVVELATTNLPRLQQLGRISTGDALQLRAQAFDEAIRILLCESIA